MKIESCKNKTIFVPDSFSSERTKIFLTYNQKNVELSIQDEDGIRILGFIEIGDLAEELEYILKNIKDN